MRVLAIVLIILVLAIVPTIGSSTHAADAKPGEGLVIFTRKDVMKGKAVQFNIDQDGRPIGQLKAGTTLEVSLPPGSYNFTVSSVSLDGTDFLTINVEAGKIYRVKGKILWGWPVGRPKFEFVSETTASTSATPETLAGPALGAAVADPPAAAGRPASAVSPEFNRFIGEWDLQMWSLAADGTKVEGRGAARGEAGDGGSAMIVITSFEAAAFPQATGGGQIRFSNSRERGLMLESDFRHSDKALQFFGQFDAANQKFVFRLLGATGQWTATGIPFSSVRVEIHSPDDRSWVAETYSSIDGQSTKVQSYRFTKR